MLTVACPCGVVFARWITPADADLDFAPRGGAELKSPWLVRVAAFG